MRRLSLLLAMTFAGTAAGELQTATEEFTARFDRGALVSLTDQAGNRFVETAAKPKGTGIHLISGDHWASQAETISAWPAPGRGEERYSGFEGLDDATVQTAYARDAASGDLIITQQAQSSKKGLWGVEWSISGIPLDMSILVPGRSGVKLTPATPGSSHTFDYPIAWEAQLVVIEGQGHGFYVWAEDARGLFKRLTVNRTPEGWRLGFITMPFAPFEEQDACESARWRLNVYEGDWRVPARRYRDWADNAFKPTRVVEQGPAWVKDIRCFVIMGMNHEVLEALPERLDPRQTMLYIPSWREAGYDRDYPTYDEPFEALEPFLDRAHELGFRVMLHVNYFGCDPLNPLYEQFEPYQIRSPWGSHEKEWWLWERADPPIKFAYINPAYKPWRDMIVERFTKLCTDYDVDSLHLDQTLCIYNDYSGLIDGMSMIDGNIALHRELREALPHVALSGEGLDEATYRYEAFAQRHAWGLDHSEGTYSLTHLQAAHPIASYLMRPYTTIYGYLGCALPTDGQLYAAWNEAYQHWGVIPTLKPELGELKTPSGFSRQFFDETAFWLDRRVDIDVDGPWPADVAFPFTTADGVPAHRTRDRRLVCDGQDISRTLFGVSEARVPGSVPGWRAYNAEAILGLDPMLWYPHASTPRDLNALHVSQLPEGFTIGAVLEHDGLAIARLRRSHTATLRLATLTGSARCGSRPFNGDPLEQQGDLLADDGAQFSGSGDMISAHPPWRNGRTGAAYARFTLTLPAGGARFITGVALAAGATGEGKSDGVIFSVTARADGREVRAELHQASTERLSLELDLTPFAGESVTLELAVHPGPDHSPAFDWARWHSPRVVPMSTVVGEVGFSGISAYRVALTNAGAADIPDNAEEMIVSAECPGAVYFLPALPDAVSLPLDLASTAYETAFVSATGIVLEAPPHASALATENTVGGVKRPGLFVHPPDHGRTILNMPMTLPDDAAVFHAFVGLREGSKSDGVVCMVEVNGVEVARLKILPGEWHEMAADLSPWAGKPVVVSLVSDSDGSYQCDWTCWGEPGIRAK
jgi:Domain of unknown function (DUF6259)